MPGIEPLLLPVLVKSQEHNVQFDVYEMCIIFFLSQSVTVYELLKNLGSWRNNIKC